MTVAADHMFDSNECTTNVLHSIGIWLAWPVCRLFFLLYPVGRIIIGSCTFACLPVGISSGTSRLSPVGCLRSLSMRIWLFTFRVMQPDVSQEDNELRETWRPKNRFSSA